MDEDSRHAYGGVIVFDEAHAMANAAGSKGSRGDTAPSQQGRAGLRLQNALPDARILYVSATGATTVPGLASARRLGLWGGADSPATFALQRLLEFWPCITTISKDMAQKRVEAADRLQGGNSSVTILNACLSGYHPHPLYVVCTHFPE